VPRPPEPLWNPRLREAAKTLYATQGRASQKKKLRSNTIKKKI